MDDQPLPDKYKHLTLSEIEKAMTDVFGSEEEFNRKMHGSPWPVGRVSDAHLKRLKSVWGQELNMFKSLGPELYHIGGGTITGIGGWKLFNEALQKQLNDGNKWV